MPHEANGTFWATKHVGGEMVTFFWGPLVREWRLSYRKSKATGFLLNCVVPSTKSDTFYQVQREGLLEDGV